MKSSELPARSWLPRLSIGLTGAVFGGFGLLLFVYPELLAEVGVEISRPAGAVELRGFYGGLELGMAVFFAAAVRRPTWWPPALIVQILTLGGAALARLAALALGGGAEPLVYALMTAEAGGALVGWLALRTVRRGGVSPPTP